MEQNEKMLALEPATDEPGSASNPSGPAEAGEPRFVEPLISDCLTETFQPAGRKPRHDGWTPERVGEFLRMLAACGVVEDSCKLVGLSAAGAYALRNRREGRAFARVWDAILIHRSRARLAGELMSRSMNGCIEAIRRDGAVAAERHRYDNRLSMAMLTRLDRLAEKEAPNDDHLRALSEDMEAFIDCAAEGGDLDDFVEARRPQPPAAAPPREPDPFPDLVTLARAAGCPDYRDVPPNDIEVRDLDPTRTSEWDSDQWIRAFRSGFMTWLDIREKGDPDFAYSSGHPHCFAALRKGVDAAFVLNSDDPANPMEMKRQGRAADIDVADLSLVPIEDWTDEQCARASCSGFLYRVPVEFWEEPADPADTDGEED
jgi:hypothetical protein